MASFPEDRYLVVVGGPTASGKTSLGIELAQHFHTEIISADSRQFYRELNIGVAKPGQTELNAAPHHFINSISISDYYSAGVYEKEVLTLLNELFKKHRVVIMVGGSGLFINAVLHGFHEDVKDDGTVRTELEDLLEKEGLEYLHNILKTIDPEYFEVVDLNNPQRVMRAIELVKLTGKKHSERTQRELTKRPFKAIEVAIDHEREELYSRINKRVDQMMEEGLLDEVRALVPFKDLNSLQTVGYSELFSYLEGDLSLEDAVSKIKQNTRRYAKRQLTWFRNKSNSVWFKPGELTSVAAYIEGQMET